jgi:hypothetical protein
MQRGPESSRRFASVLAALPDNQQTLAWLAAVQAEGECWLQLPVSA